MEQDSPPETDLEPTTQRIPWPRLLLETLAIVFGILLAFSIDAWWDNRQDRAEEQQVLRGLQEEFGRHARDLEDLAVTRQQIVAHATRLMEFLASDDLEMSLAALDSAAFRTAYAGTWDPGNSALNALISSGRLELIASSELRTALTEWQAVVDEVRDNQVEMRTYSTHVLWPALARRGILKRAWNYNQRYPDWPVDSEGVARYERLRGDVELIDLISTKSTWWFTDEIDEGQAAAARILGLIESQLR